MSSSELEELLFFKDADTLAIIDPPSYKPGWSITPWCDQSIGHRIHSVNLLATGSSVFKRLFEKKAQERNIKRRGEPPEGIKYIIDLTPPSTEDDAVLILTELSCPAAIRTWDKSQGRWSRPKSPSKHDKTAPSKSVEHADLPEEYSPARHREGIVQILKVLEGQNPDIDSPCKLWTFFALANLYEIATLPPIKTRVANWVYEEKNMRFFELHPEIAYRIGKGIQCDYLLRDAFAVLVGEEALLHLANSSAPSPNKPRLTIHGRIRESLEDDDVQRVQYAGESFLSRIIEGFIELTGAEMHWLNNSTMYQNIVNYRPWNEHELKAVNDLILSLKDFIRASVFVSLSQYSQTWLPDEEALNEASESCETYPTQDFLRAYGRLNAIERIASRTFWTLLTDSRFKLHDVEAALKEFSDRSLADIGRYMGAFRYQENAKIRFVSRNELISKADAFNSLSNRFLPCASGEPPWAMTPTLGKDTGLFDASGYFSLTEFLLEAECWITIIGKRMLKTPRSDITYDLTDTLTCLTENEFKYLPLWAGGCDDGTGGVYADQIPLAETNEFSGPGPSIHISDTASSYSPSAISVLESTVHGASHRATESHYSEVVSINSEAMSDAGNVTAVFDAEAFIESENRYVAVDSLADDEFYDLLCGSESDTDGTVVGEHTELDEFGRVGFE
ncbi:hypothetical protein BJX61DRAFT_383789 [Aspergillus egyptiacus]|nr:hypothetical protein BJX61DRAFT_383789 [Aspergillus egyptiacus]